LVHAHARGVVHRDLKPGNVLVDGAVLKVADFGIAQVRVAGLEMTEAGVVMGTYSYMSPEQKLGLRHVDGRTDLYALGVMLHELLTGKTPQGSFRPPSAQVPGLPPELDAVVTRA